MSRFLSARLQALAPYVPGEQPKVKLIKLNTNESPFPPAPGVKEAVAEAADSLQLYNDLSAAKLTKLLSETYGVKENQIAVSNGSDEMLAFAFQAFGGRGLTFPDITYGFYPVWANLYGLDAKSLPLTEDFSIDISDYRSNDRCIVIANPNAPTGIALRREEVEQILQANPYNVVVIDEAYVDFGAESCVPLIREYDNLLVIQTFSKSRSLAGGRLGYGAGNPELIRDLNTMKYSTNPYTINRMTMAAGIACLEHDEYNAENSRKIQEVRDWTRAELTKLGFEVTPSRANFLFARHPDISGEELYRQLKSRGILIRHFSGERIRDYNRITIGTREEMGVLLQQTEAILASVC